MANATFYKKQKYFLIAITNIAMKKEIKFNKNNKSINL